VKESYLYQQLKQGNPGAHFARVENMSGTGMADVNCCFGGREFWIELKMATTDKVRHVRPAQIAWAMSRSQAGGKVLVLVRKGDDVYLFWGVDLLALRDLGIKHLVSTGRCIWKSGKPVNWSALLNEMVNCPNLPTDKNNSET